MNKLGITYNDPITNEVLLAKRNWNLRVSKLINDFIHFKKLLNGAPSKYKSDGHTIAKPLPNIALQILPQIISDFNDVANEARAIIDAQFNSYMKRIERQRAKAQNKATKTPAAPSPEGGTDLSKQIQASNRAAEYFLITEASNPLSRFFNKLFTPGIGFDSEAARLRRLRMSLLNFVADINKSLKMLQKQIAGSGSDSILTAHQMLGKAENDYVFLSSAIQAAKQAAAPVPVDFGGDPTIQSCVRAIADLDIHGNSFKNMGELKLEAQSMRKAITEKDVSQIQTLSTKFLADYQLVLDYTCHSVNLPKQKSFADIDALLSTRKPQDVTDADDQLQATAQNLLGKWRHQIWPFDKTSAFRLDIYNAAKSARKLANDIMNILEMRFSIEDLEPLVIELGNSLFALKNKMAVMLHAIKEVEVTPKEKSDFAKRLR